MKHPDLATDFKLNGKCLKTAYMNLLLGLIETLRRPPLSFSDSELSNANSELSELTKAGFKLDWLKGKLEDISLKRKNAIDDGSRVKEVEKRINNLKVTLSDLKVELEFEKARSAAANQPLSFDDIV